MVDNSIVQDLDVILGVVSVDLLNSFLLWEEIIDSMLGRQLYDSLIVDMLQIFSNLCFQNVCWSRIRIRSNVCFYSAIEGWVEPKNVSSSRSFLYGCCCELCNTQFRSVSSFIQSLIVYGIFFLKDFFGARNVWDAFGNHIWL